MKSYQGFFHPFFYLFNNIEIVRMQEKNEDPFNDQIQVMLDREMEKFYSRKTIDYYKNPVNIGRMENSNGLAVVKGGCGDTMEIYLRIEGKVIKAIQFFSDGCGVTLACGSAITELVNGKSIQKALRISPHELIEELGGLPRDGIHCAILSVVTMHMAIADYLLKTE